MTSRRLIGVVECVGVWLAIVLSPSMSSGQQPVDQQSLEAREEQAFKEASAMVAPSVVRIQTVGGLDRVGRVLTGTAATTGVVVSADGYVISSAFNFASRPSSVLLTLADGRRFPARIIANDRSRMLTLLKIDVEGLKVPRVAPRDGFRVGQWAIAMGRTYESPLPNLSVGIISALNRIWGRALQTDAKISPANYGGPLVDIRGQVIGVLVPLSQRRPGQTAGVEWYDSGIGFAIPMADI
ncbi:MAG: trypsin-like peptidase domain-containing protein, partial [Planctomycetaceae bacterium]